MSVITGGGLGAAGALLCADGLTGGSFGGAFSFGTVSVGKPTRGSPSWGSAGTAGETAGYRKTEKPET